MNYTIRTPPRDVKPGDRIRRRYRDREDVVTVTRIKKKSNTIRGTRYYVQFERPEGVHPNEMADHFYISPHSKLYVVYGK